MPALYKHQQQSIDFFRTRPRGLDFSDAGTGKTRVQIELFAERRANGGKRALILAPKSLMESAWQDDFKKFAPFIQCITVYADNRNRITKNNQQGFDVLISNTDAVRWLVRQPAAFFEQFDTLIVDEITAFKHRTSLRSRCLAKLAKRFEYRYALTGTPNSNSILDIWHQVFIIDDGQRLGSSFFSFRNTAAYPIQVGPQVNMVKWEDKPGAATAIASLLADITVRHKLEECLDLPSNNVYSCYYDLTPKQLAAYNQMEDHAILEVTQNDTINAVNAAVLATKLLQIASGTVYDESGTSVHIEGNRYQLIYDLVTARRHSLVFFNWRHQADALETLFQKGGIPYCRFDGNTPARDRGKLVRDFQAGLYQVCLAQPQSAAHGLTLTRATTAIWASPTYNLEHFLQGNRRIYRAGQTRKTETILITARKTIEEKVYERLSEKNAKQIDFLRFIQHLKPPA